MIYKVFPFFTLRSSKSSLSDVFYNNFKKIVYVNYFTSEKEVFCNVICRLYHSTFSDTKKMFRLQFIEPTVFNALSFIFVDVFIFETRRVIHIYFI